MDYYYGFSWVLIELISGLLINLALPIVIIIIVILAIKSSNKKTQTPTINSVNDSNPYPFKNVVQPKVNQNTSELPNQDQPYSEVVAKSPRKSNPNTGLNILLLVGSFLIISAIAIFAFSSTTDIVKPIAVILTTVLLYTLGTFLYKTQKHLIPAAKALIGTALAIVPFWIPLLNEYTILPSATIWLIVSIIGTIAYIFTAIILESQIVAYCSFAFFLSFAFSAVNSLTLPMIWFFITAIATSCAASIIYFVLCKKIPKYYRNSFLVTGKYLTPIVLMSSLLAAPESSPYMYTILFTLATLQYTLTYLIDKSYSNELFLRIIAHVTILVIVAEVLIRGDFDIASNLKPIIFGITWLATSTFHTFLCVTNISTASRKNVDAQMILSILGILAIVSSMIFFSGIDSSQSLLIFTIILGIIAILASLARKTYKNTTWTCIANTCLLLIPITIINSLDIRPDIANACIFAIYLIIAPSASLVIPHCLKTLKNNESREIITQAGLINIFSSVAMIISATNLDTRIHWLSWLMVAFCLTTYFYIIRKPKLYEISIYVTAISVTLLTKLIADSFVEDQTLINILAWHIPVIAVLCASAINESKRPASNRPRFILGFIALFMLSALVGIIAITNNDPLYANIFLIEQIIFLIVGYLVHVKWIIITAAVGTILALIYYLKDLQWLLLAILGAVLIIFVIWRLSKANKEENHQKLEKNKD